MNTPTLTIVTVATDRYLDFWTKLFESALQFIDSEIKVEWILFTNRIENLSLKVLNSRIVVTPIYQESLDWPFPTLLRYKMIFQNREKFKGKLILHLDADMIFVAPLADEDLHSDNAESFIKLIPHPGYFRPRGINRLSLYMRHPRIFIRDLKLFLHFGSIGTWERNCLSLAFVPRRKRKTYFCGGTWFGTKEAILNMCQVLSDRVEEDLKKDLIATHHDESHINWFGSNFRVEIGSVSMCHEPSYPQLKGIIPLIRAVDKNEKAPWIR